MARLQANGSLLDYVQEATKSLNRTLGATDRVLVNDYLDSVREVEGRVSKLMAKADSLGNLPDAPLGTPDDFSELLDIQFDMITLAWQTGQTRIASMRMMREATNAHLPIVNVDEAFHPLSHHGEDPTSTRSWCACRPTRRKRFTRFLKRLQGIKEGNSNHARQLDHPVRLEHGQQRPHNTTRCRS